MNIESLFQNVNDNIAYLVANAPDLTLVTKAWGTITVLQAQVFALDVQANIDLATNFLSNPRVQPPSNLVIFMDEFQDVRGLTSWEGLTLEDRAHRFKALQLRDLYNLSRSTRGHRSRILAGLASMQKN